MSDGKHVFVFRQAVAAGDPDALVRTRAGALTGAGASGEVTAVAPGALLCDRFVLAGGELRPVVEVRYRRSRHRTRPDSAKDGLGIKDMNGVPFHEPTLELGFAGRPEAGRFAVLLVPTGIAGTSRWQLFVHNAQSRSIEAINVEQGEDGLFHTQGSRLWTSPDPQYRDSVLERAPGTCPFTQQPLVPVAPRTEFAESALGLPGASGQGYGEAAAPSRFGAAAYTVEAWVEPQAAGGTVLSTGADGVTLSVSAEGALVLAHGTDTLDTDDGLVGAGVFTHVAAVYDGTQATLLVDGARVATGDLAVAAAPGQDGRLLLGATDAASEASEVDAASEADAASEPSTTSTTSTTAGHFAGVLDEVRVWSRARRLPRVAQTRGERLVGDEPELVAYYRFDEGLGSTAYDQSPSAAHAALKGTTSWVASDAPVADHPGIRRDAFRVTGRTVVGGLSAVLHHQQEEGLVGSGSVRPLKRQARVLLTWTASAAGDTKGRIAALDVAVGRDGRLAQLTDVVDLPVIGTSVEAVDPARQNQLKADILRDKALLKAARQGKAQLKKDRANPDNAEKALSAALRRAAVTGKTADPQGTTCVLYATYFATAYADAYAYAYAYVGREYTASRRSDVVSVLTVVPDGKGGYRPSLSKGAPAAGNTATQWVFNGKTLKSVKAGKSLTGQGPDKDIVLGDGAGLWPRPSSQPNSLVLRDSAPKPPKPAKKRPSGALLYSHSPHQEIPLVAAWSNGRLKWGHRRLRGAFYLYAIPVSPAGADQVKNVAEVAAALARVDAVNNADAAFGAWNAQITSLTTAVKKNEDELGRLSAYTTGRSDRTLPMARIGQDRLGLGWSGALLDFAVTSDSPHLAESGTGHLGLYYRDDQDRLTGLFYNTNIDRSTKTVAASDGTTVLLTARDAGVDLAGVTIKVSTGDTDDRCTLTLALQDGDTETWALLPREAEGFAASINGMRDTPLPWARSRASRTVC
ncbi:LamG domain-containing protein [Kitasatospora sp. NPDC094016]|uniref:LamG domain-containing protein n=1 Tax=Kitasatospora sp. NPDC094016 TaxID=3154986 RepID=UPI003319A32C